MPEGPFFKEDLKRLVVAIIFAALHGPKDMEPDRRKGFMDFMKAFANAIGFTIDEE